jgi:hypothetical protein
MIDETRTLRARSGMGPNAHAAPLSLRRCVERFCQCLTDDSGTAMTEYLVITTVMMPAVFFLFHPDNGIYKAFRDQYDMTAMMLMFPGP